MMIDITKSPVLCHTSEPNIGQEMPKSGLAFRLTSAMLEEYPKNALCKPLRRGHVQNSSAQFWANKIVFGNAMI
jgi:hypothetical protein